MLADPARKEAQEFRALFPDVLFLDPLQLLRELEKPN
jgi:hypothetical protein